MDKLSIECDLHKNIFSFTSLEKKTNCNIMNSTKRGKIDEKNGYKTNQPISFFSFFVKGQNN